MNSNKSVPVSEAPYSRRIIVMEHPEIYAEVQRRAEARATSVAAFVRGAIRDKLRKDAVIPFPSLSHHEPDTPAAA